MKPSQSHLFELLLIQSQGSIICYLSSYVFCNLYTHNKLVSFWLADERGLWMAVASSGVSSYPGNVTVICDLEAMLSGQTISCCATQEPVWVLELKCWKMLQKILWYSKDKWKAFFGEKNLISSFFQDCSILCSRSCQIPPIENTHSNLIRWIKYLVIACSLKTFLNYVFILPKQSVSFRILSVGWGCVPTVFSWGMFMFIPFSFYSHFYYISFLQYLCLSMIKYENIPFENKMLSMRN